MKVIALQGIRGGCLLYHSDAADDLDGVELGGCRDVTQSDIV